ncbi:MAG: hypothetical protein ACYDA8_01895 [Deferrisomatales bacterium]
MTHTDGDRQHHRLSLDPEVAQTLSERGAVSDLDRAGFPHFLIKVPDLEKAGRSDLGLEVEREDDGCVALSILLYDIPTEPVSYDIRFYPDQPDDLRFLWRLVEVAQFRVHPCEPGDAGWGIGQPQTFRLPPNVLLRLKHYALEWPKAEATEPPEVPADAPPAGDAAPARVRSPDPRDTVIRKLKEQVQALRAQIQERDKRIIELEDELNEIKSRGRPYRLTGEKKPWWKPFS